MKTPFYFARSKTTRAILGLALMFLWGGIGLLYALFKIIKDRQKFFHVKKREEPPEILNDPSLGKHHFVQLSVII